MQSSLLLTFGISTCADDNHHLNSDPVFVNFRGSISIKNRNICNIDGLVAHLSSLACYQVHEKASSLQGRLSAEMVPRLEIWPNSFLKNGGPMDDSIALYFFPSSESDRYIHIRLNNLTDI